MQNVNPIFNLLPDILSSLGAEQVPHLCTEWRALTRLGRRTTMLPRVCCVCLAVSHLTACGPVQGLSDAAFQAIMHTLLGYVKRDKFVDHLSERLAARLGSVAEVRSVPVSARAASEKIAGRCTRSNAIQCVSRDGPHLVVRCSRTCHMWMPHMLLVTLYRCRLCGTPVAPCDALWCC